MCDANNATPPADGQTPPSAPPSAPDWTAGLNEDLKGYVQNKGFKDPVSVVDSYRNLEKLVGQRDKLIKLPEKDDDADGWKEVFTKLGRPEKPEEYKIPVPEGDKGEFAKEASQWFHEAGLSRKQADKLAAKWNEHMGNMSAKSKADNEALVKTAETALKKEWGAAFEQNMQKVDQAFDKLGLTEAQGLALRQAMGPAEALKFIHSLSTKLGEDTFIGGDKRPGGFGVMTPEQARNKIESLRNDSDFVKRYAAGGASEREQMILLHQMAYPTEG